MAVEIHQVETRKDLKQFILYPYRLYRGNPYYVPKLVSDEWKTLSRDKNPAYTYCDVDLWLAYKNGNLAGRIAGIINHRYIGKWKEKKARFGWIDFIDNRDVSEALLSTVESWAASRGMEYVEGPLGFTDMDPEGMLIEGFDELGTLPMIYNYPYYPEHLAELGYEKEVDWLEYEIKNSWEIPEKVKRVQSLVLKRSKLRLLDAKKAKDIFPYASKLFDTLNEGYRDLFGFVELDEEQKEIYTKQYFPFIDPDFTKLVLDENDDVAAFGIAMPSLSRALQKSRGRLFPFGFIHILWALKFPKRIDMYLVAIKPKYQKLGINAILMGEITAACIRRGIKSAETSGELEDNTTIRDFWKNYDKRQHKRRRCFQKKIV